VPAPLNALAARSGGRVATPGRSFAPSALRSSTGFADGRAPLRGRKVAIDVADMADALGAMIELEGWAARIAPLPPGLSSDARRDLLAVAETDAIVGDGHDSGLDSFAYDVCALRPSPPHENHAATQWALPTSGTSGKPKLALHGLASLTAGIAPSPPTSWGTFYDIRRYGGLQIALRALLCGGDLTLTSADEPLAAYLARLVAAGATHVSGTPSHWRRVLMDASTSGFAPRAIRLSGEIADQGALDALRARFPGAEIVHAYASTEAGVGFAVHDGLAGFPARWLNEARTPALRIEGGTLRLKGPGVASAVLGTDGAPFDAEGFIDSGDAVAVRDGRCHFLGRVNGAINVGGAKVNPEVVEAALAAHEDVAMARVSARRNPITGAIVVAEIVARPGASASPALGRAILAQAAARLKPHETPAMVKFVDRLELTAAGKVARHG